MACSSAPTTTRMRGTTEIRRNTRKIRSERSTDRLPADGINDMPTIRKSNQFQPVRKKAGPNAMILSATSAAKMIMITPSTVSSTPPHVAITVSEVSRPRVIALITISAVIDHWKVLAQRISARRRRIPSSG
jgi:hypothetical protein